MRSPRYIMSVISVGSMSRIPTEILASRFLAGDSIAALMADYDITNEQVETALRYELVRELHPK